MAATGRRKESDVPDNPIINKIRAQIMMRDPDCVAPRKCGQCVRFGECNKPGGYALTSGGIRQRPAWSTDVACEYFTETADAPDAGQD